MARGGLRLGAGRKKRDSDAPATAPEKSNPKSNGNQTAAKSKRLSPLDYMLSVINDPEVDDGRRDRMAIAAAPYVHARAADAKLGKKEEAEQAALTAERGTNWDSLLDPPIPFGRS